MSRLDETVAERDGRYGGFANVAAMTQHLKDQVRQSKNWCMLPYVNRQAIDVILEKIARSVLGDPMYVDNWHDIQGYAKLVEDEINKVSAVHD